MEEAVIVGAVRTPVGRLNRAELSQQTRLLETVMAATPDQFFMLDRRGRCMYANPAAARAAAMEPRAMLGQTVNALPLPRGVKKDFQRRLKSVVASGERAEGKASVPAAGGERYYEYIISPLASPKGAVESVVVTVRNLTRLKQQAEAVQAGEARFRALVENASDLIVIVDQAGKVTYQNPTVGQVLGYAQGELLDRSLFAYVHAGDLATVSQAFATLLESGGSVAIDCRVRHADGSWRWMEAFGTNLIDNPSVGGIFGILKDVTVQREVREQSQMLARLEERERIARDLHDGIIQTLYGLRLNLGSRGQDERRRPAAEVGERLDEVIRDIRNFIFDLHPHELNEANLETGLRLLAEEVRVNALLTPDLSLASGAGVGLDREATNNVLLMAREALWNIIRHARATSVLIELEHGGNQLVLTIRDNGRGFSPEKAAQSQGDGLRNLRERATAIGGLLAINSRPGWGTEVRIEVPVAQPADLKGLGSAPIRLLIVDDHSIVRLGLERAFREFPSVDVVGQAQSAAEAVTEARRCNPDVVLMDVRLPDGSGIEACREIRSDRAETKVLMLTSYSDEEAIVGAIMAGAAGYLLKQNEPAQLVEAIERIAQGDSLLDEQSTKTVMSAIRDAGGAGATGVAASEGPFEVLTDQERRILPLIADGKTNREIGVMLALSEHTVRTYMSHIFQKLHITRRAEAAALLVRSQRAGRQQASAGP